MKNLKGSISGGVDISHKGPKMSGKAKDLMSFPGGMPGPGAYGSVGNKVVGKGMAEYMAGEPVGMKKYKDEGPKKSKTMVKGPDGKMVPDYAVDGKGSGDLKKSSPGKYDKIGPKKMSGESYDMKQAYNKNLTEGARFNYLKNALHDKGGMKKYKK